jgi:hypothetical protein
MKSLFRQDIVTECLHEIRAALSMQRSNEAALNMNNIGEKQLQRAEETIAECKEKVREMTAKVNHQIDHLKQDLLDVTKEIEILGGGDFAELANQQNAIENKLARTEKELEYASKI